MIIGNAPPPTTAAVAAASVDHNIAVDALSVATQAAANATANAAATTTAAGDSHEQKFVPLVSVVNLKKPVFFDELHSYYESAAHTDTVIKVRDGERRAHSIVLGAASSLFRFMFDEIADKILDSEYVLCFPDLTLQVNGGNII